MLLFVHDRPFTFNVYLSLFVREIVSYYPYNRFALCPLVPIRFHLPCFLSVQFRTSLVTDMLYVRTLCFSHATSLYVRLCTWQIIPCFMSVHAVWFRFMSVHVVQIRFMSVPEISLARLPPTPLAAAISFYPWIRRLPTVVSLEQMILHQMLGVDSIYLQVIIYFNFRSYITQRHCSFSRLARSQPLVAAAHVYLTHWSADTHNTERKGRQHELR